jgi:hypothetical protein
VASGSKTTFVQLYYYNKTFSLGQERSSNWEEISGCAVFYGCIEEEDDCKKVTRFVFLFDFKL